eukprot:TRINITY_DN29387_c0_g2_i1.p1 TRINITY_DN29387_c0_g2~~TRINITY_DN29387_c0_g2_i1.p1  ORF type:complete len:474 (+),score=68.73 TRINITY_DN29387_c0_g2_i1:71-1423(+)
MFAPAGSAAALAGCCSGYSTGVYVPVYTGACQPAWHGAGGNVPDAVWHKLRHVQGLLREWQKRAGKAEASLRREVARRKSAEGALAAERRKSTLRQQEANIAARRATDAERKNCILEARLARASAQLQVWGAALYFPPPRPLESTCTMTESPRARGAALDLPDTPRASAVLPSPRTRGATASIPGSPRTLVCSEAGSAQTRDPAASAVAPCTPQQSPERSDADPTPGPPSPRLRGDAADRLCPELPTPCAKEAEAAAGDLAVGPLHRRSKSKAAKVLLEDNVCFWVATFVRRDWARACISSARAVWGVISVCITGWIDTCFELGQFQSMGWENEYDASVWGPAPGPIMEARVEIYRLRLSVKHDDRYDRTVTNWISRWRLHMDFTMLLYEEMRLRLREVFQRMKQMTQGLQDVAGVLQDMLEARDRRLAMEEEADDGAAEQSLPPVPASD